MPIILCKVIVWPMRAKSKKTRPNPGVHCARITENTLILDPSKGYQMIKLFGSGTFGAVFLARDPFGRCVSVKKVIQDYRYKNRELEILQKLNHPNCLFLENSYVTCEGTPSEHYLHLVTKAFPMDLSAFLKQCPFPPLVLVKVFAYQLFCGVSYLHSLNICHRDIKARNVLVDPDTGLLQICDFGSAKPIALNEVSVSYIATRNYRAPELLYNCTTYSTPVDVWACGCVLSEMILGRPLFSGDKNAQMIDSIAAVLGSPKPSDIVDMNGDVVYSGKKKKAQTMKKAFGGKIDAGFSDLMSSIFVYSPKTRFTARQCLTHPCFEEIRSKPTLLPNGVVFIPPANENTNYGLYRAC